MSDGTRQFINDGGPSFLDGYGTRQFIPYHDFEFSTYLGQDYGNDRGFCLSNTEDYWEGIAEALRSPVVKTVDTYN